MGREEERIGGKTVEGNEDHGPIQLVVSADSSIRLLKESLS